LALRDYELVVILNPEIGDDALPDSLLRVEQAITSRGGEVVESNNWGRRRLAYPIQRHFEGSYIVSQIKLDPTLVPELEGTFRISEDVIRHMIIRADEVRPADNGGRGTRTQTAEQDQGSS
jgi:small subunit ribosomal protein S6